MYNANPDNHCEWENCFQINSICKGWELCGYVRVHVCVCMCVLCKKEEPTLTAVHLLDQGSDLHGSVAKVAGF